MNLSLSKKVFYIKVALNPIFRPLYNLTSNQKDKQVLEDAVIDMFSSVYYPLNKNLDKQNVAITMTSATERKGVILLVQIELYIIGKEFKQEIEKNIPNLQMKPDFVKYIKIMNVLD